MNSRFILCKVMLFVLAGTFGNATGGIATGGIGVAGPLRPRSEASDRVKLGIDVLRERKFDLLQGKRVGLVTNPTGVTA
ncbi:MAG: hypothetical protein HY966_05200, partial [Ignavibacteriales bacterium]|nr:hypothetical protein [Ignavibacteriales bacterium]